MRQNPIEMFLRPRWERGEVKGMKSPVELDQIANMVLRYRPKPKSKASRKRAKKAAKKGKG
jgi:hypothetical protein